MVAEYITALKQELAYYQSMAEGYRLDSVYFGGGTPGLLSPRQLQSICNAIRAVFDVRQDAQWCLEINPSYMTQAKVKSWYSLGFERLSLGVQSMNPDILHFLGRDHNPQDVINALNMCQSFPFKSISIDMMLGIPGQKKQDCDDMLALIDQFKLKHLSVYTLCIEPATVFKQKAIKPLAEDLTVDHFQYCVEALAERNLDRYEVSNFAKPGFESVHNKFYWLRKPYIGIGPSAHSFFENRRYKRKKSLIEYIQEPVPKIPKQKLSRRELFKDFWVGRTRYLKPILFEELNAYLKRDTRTVLVPCLEAWQQQGWLRYNEDHFYFESEGLLRLDTLIQEIWERLTCLKS